MGYTHYWHAKDDGIIAPEAWTKIMVDTKLIVDAMADELAFDFNAPSRAPEINEDFIRFNGKGEAGHETFLLSQDLNDFDFCKTAHMPYDRAVCAVLAVAAEHAPDAITIGSDGCESDWKPHLDWASGVLGRIIRFPVEQST